MRTRRTRTSINFFSSVKCEKYWIEIQWFMKAWFSEPSNHIFSSVLSKKYEFALKLFMNPWAVKPSSNFFSSMKCENYWFVLEWFMTTWRTKTSCHFFSSYSNWRSIFRVTRRSFKAWIPLSQPYRKNQDSIVLLHNSSSVCHFQVIVIQ